MACVDLVARANAQSHLSLGIFARRDRLDVVVLKLAGNCHSRVDSLKECVDSAVPLAVAADLSAIAADDHAPGGRSRGRYWRSSE